MENKSPTINIFVDPNEANHMAIQVLDEDGNQTGTHGFYPDKENGGIIDKHNYIYNNGIIKDDSKNLKDMVLVKSEQIPAGGDEKIQQKVEDMKENPENYSLVGNNCIDVVAEIAKEGGMEGGIYKDVSQEVLDSVSGPGEIYALYNYGDKSKVPAEIQKEVKEKTKEAIAKADEVLRKTSEKAIEVIDGTINPKEQQTEEKKVQEFLKKYKVDKEKEEKSQKEIEKQKQEEVLKKEKEDKEKREIDWEEKRKEEQERINEEVIAKQEEVIAKQEEELRRQQEEEKERKSQEEEERKREEEEERERQEEEEREREEEEERERQEEEEREREEEEEENNDDSDEEESDEEELESNEFTSEKYDPNKEYKKRQERFKKFTTENTFEDLLMEIFLKDPSNLTQSEVDTISKASKSNNIYQNERKKLERKVRDFYKTHYPETNIDSTGKMVNKNNYTIPKIETPLMTGYGEPVSKAMQNFGNMFAKSIGTTFSSEKDAVEHIQRELNKQENNNLKVDGIMGPKTRGAIKNNLVLSGGNREFKETHGINDSPLKSLIEGIFGKSKK